MKKLTKWDYIGIGMFLLLGSLTFKVHADWSGVAGVGKASFSWCGPDGCWHQQSLPYTSNRKVWSDMLGVRHGLNPHLDMDILLHDFGVVNVDGTYTKRDEDYNTYTKQVSPGAALTTASMKVRTTGLSATLSPHYKLGPIQLRGRAGLFYYRQHIDYAIGSFLMNQTAYRSTWLAGAGIELPIDRLTFGIEYDLFGIVKIDDSPIGGWESSHPGVRQVMGTMTYRF